jgi:hypothetical protein
LARALLPMKLSSTINTASRQPAARNWSSSASTCATALVRGPPAIDLDDVAELAVEGQPREYCTAMVE